MIYALPKGVILENADGTWVFLLENGDAAVVNSIGGLIIQRLIDEGEKACCNFIVNAYDIGEDEAGKDIAEFAAVLETYGLVERAS